METYLVRLKPRSPYLTPWRNCTLWGRLTWIVADGRLPGWDIDTWIARYKAGMPPLVVGDAFPEEAVPVPALRLATANGTEKRPKTLPWEDWKKLCASGDWPPEIAQVRAQPKVERMHVVMSRATGTALLLDDPEKPDKKRGQLRTEVGDQPETLILLAQVNDTLGKAGLETLIRELCLDGWGQGRTYGYGHIESLGIEDAVRPAPTGWVATLGHCHPTSGLPQDGYWRLTGVPVRPHDAETRRAQESQQFTTMLLPGASFATDELFIGQSLSSDARANYLHGGLAPTWPLQKEA